MRVRLRGACLHVFDVAAQGYALLVLRVQTQDFAHVTFGTEQVALAQRRLAKRYAFVQGADQLQLANAFLGAAVVRLQGEHPAIAHSGIGEVMADAVAVGLANQGLDSRLAAVGQGDIQLCVTRVVAQGLFQAGDAGLVLALFHQLVAVLANRTGAATGNGHAQRHEQKRSRLAQL
ncbi:hypothetical protein D3C76_984070 [compost metagenome]